MKAHSHMKALEKSMWEKNLKLRHNTVGWLGSEVLVSKALGRLRR